MIFGKHINRYYLKYGLYFLIGIIALMVVDYVQLIIPDVTGSIIEGLQYSTLTETLLKSYVMQIVVVAGILVIGRVLWRLFIFGTSRRIDYELRNDMFRHAEKLSRRFYHQNKSGGLMALFINDLNAVRMAFGPGMMMFFDIIFLGGLAFWRMYELDHQLTYFAVIPLILVSLLAAFISRITGKKFKEKQKAFENMSDFTQENFYGISVIKAFVNELREIRDFAKINKDNFDKNISFIKASAMMSVGVDIFVNTIRIMIIGLGGWLVYKTIGLEAGAIGKFSVGDLTRYISYFGTMIWPMMAIGRLINMRSQANASLSRINQFLDEPIEINDAIDVLPIEEIKGEIIFNHLTFTYPSGSRPAVKDISFTIRPGTLTGIVGRTGSGKTTLVDLLLRMYNLEPNQILIDGFDIMKIPLKTIRNAIGYVPQDNFIFSDTVENNIAFALDELDKEAVVQMAKYSDVHENIADFPDQYVTLVGERGVTLSGGQKQRISIARALLKEPNVLIMDDSFSAVDTKTEESILSNLKEVRQGKTTIVIANRISTIKNADLILVIDDGMLVGKGTHEELFATVPLYRETVLRQQLEQEVERGDE